MFHIVRVTNGCIVEPVASHKSIAWCRTDWAGLCARYNSSTVQYYIDMPISS